MHAGFPCFIVYEQCDFTRPCDRAVRFLQFSSTDVQVDKTSPELLSPLQVQTRVAMPIFHILQRYDPRDLQSNLASYRYNTVLNSVDRMLRKFVLEF